MQIKLLRTQAEQIQSEGQTETKPSTVEKEMNEATAVGQEDLLTGGDSTCAVSPTASVLTPESANNVDSENAALKGETTLPL